MLEPEQVLPPIIIDELVPRRMQRTFRPFSMGITGIESILINGLPAHMSSNHVASNNFFFSYHVPASALSIELRTVIKLAVAVANCWVPRIFDIRVEFKGSLLYCFDIFGLFVGSHQNSQALCVEINQALGPIGAGLGMNALLQSWNVRAAKWFRAARRREDKMGGDKQGCRDSQMGVGVFAKEGQTEPKL
ncbi:hypothetical protein DFH07DRAFT_1033455 [Mycena maculata]|uniref:Uncharacterized protein n=1 Tax=Mycena maculata TaxID=230809 RepID=A0AAD7K5S5_9AGAR|nr:hypothetical protein DFH07DRAFT_1033455 [Mycena maculata]